MTRQNWLVSVNLPIEAVDSADAAAQFWAYLRELGADELPVFVSPADDELAMQVYVGGEQHDLDPEED